jgi:hypothetical protein
MARVRPGHLVQREHEAEHPARVDEAAHTRSTRAGRKRRTGAGPHRLAGADALKYGVGAHAVGQFFDAGHAIVAAYQPVPATSDSASRLEMSSSAGCAGVATRVLSSSGTRTASAWQLTGSASRRWPAGGQAGEWQN